MLKNKYTYKDTISMSERISATEFIADSYFQTNGETGITDYVPYFHELAEVFVFTDYFLQGYTFTDKENKYETIMSNKELQRLYEEFYTNNQYFAKILADVRFVVDFRKQQLLHPLGELIKKLSSVDAKTFSDIIQHNTNTNKKTEELID